MGIGSSGLLVEDNGALSSGALAGQYENFMGAGTGSVGLPKPSAVVDTNALSSAQYLGFVTGTGAYSQSGTVGPLLPSRFFRLFEQTGYLLRAYSGYSDDYIWR